MDNWFDITRSDQYKELSPEDRIAVKQRFFERFMLPKMDEDPDLADPNVKQATYIKFMQSPDDTGEGFVRSMAGAAARGFGEMVPGTVEGVGALTGIQPLREAGQAMREGLESIAPVNPIYAEGIPAQVANLAGNVGSIIATGGVGGAIGKGVAGAGRAAQAIQTGARSAVIGTGFAQGAAGKASENEQLGITGPEAYLNILGGGLAQTLPEVLPFGTALETAAARRLLGGADEAGRIIPGVRMSAAQEGVEGAASQVLSNISTQLAAPEGVQTPGIFEGVGEAALWESVGGGMFGVINKLGRTPPERQTPQQQQAAAEFNASPVDQKPDITPEESLQNAQQGGIPVVPPDGEVAWLPAMREAITQPAIQGPTQPSVVEQRLQTAISLAETAAANPEASQAAAAAAQVINEVAQTAPIETPPTPKPKRGKKIQPITDLAAQASAKLRGQAPQDISAGLQAAIPPSLPETGPPVVDQEAPAGTPVQAAPIQPQPVETQEDATPEVPIEESVRQEPQDRIESRTPEEAGVGDQLLRPATGEEEVAPNALAAAKARNVTFVEPPNEFVERAWREGVPGERDGFVSFEDTYVIDPRQLPEGAIVGEDFSSYALPNSEGLWRTFFMDVDGLVRVSPVLTPDLEAAIAAKQTQQPASPTKGAKPTTATEGAFTPGGVATERDIETGAPKLDPKNDYFASNLASRAWRIAAGMQWDDNAGDWVHPNYPGRSRSVVESEITESNPPPKADVQRVFNELAKSYGREDLIKGEKATEQETDEQRFQRIKALKPSQRSDDDIAFANEFSKRQKELKPQAGESTRKAFLANHTASIGGRLRKALDQGMNFRGLKGTVGSWVENLYNEGWRMALDARGNRQFTNGTEALGSSGLGKVGMNYADFLSSQPQTKQAAETQTPVPLREGTGAAGVVQSEPVEGSIPTVENVSPETETTSTEKADVVSAAMADLNGKILELPESAQKKWTPVQAAPIQPLETQEDAIPQQIPDEGVLRQERPEMELQAVGEGNIQPEEVAREGEIQEGSIEKTTEELRSKLASMPQKADRDSEVGTLSINEANRAAEYGSLSREGRDLNNEYVIWANPFSEEAFAYRKSNGDVAYKAKLTDLQSKVEDWKKKASEARFIRQRIELRDRINEAKPAPKISRESKTTERIPLDGMLPPGDLGTDDSPSQEEVVTPPGEPTTATEGMVTPGGVATERDLTNPEQMTPDEVNSIWNDAKDWANTPDSEIVAKYQKQFNASDAYIQAHPFAPEYWRETQRKIISGASPLKQHTKVLNSAIAGKKPVSAAAVDTYGIKLPEGYVKQGDLYIFQPQTTAAETQTPVPLREGTGAAGVARTSLEGGRSSELPQVSPETETTSTEKADVVSSVDRLLESNASSEEMDRFVKTLTDDQFNELVRSEGYDVDPKLTIKPKDSYDAKRMKRRELVNQLRKEVVANQRIAKTAQQVIQQEEVEAKKQLAGEEMRSKALDSIIGNAEKKDREFGQVQVADAAQAMAMLQNSGEVPGVLTAWVGNSKDFLADPQNEQIDPEVYNRVKRSGPDEGLFNKGRVYIFLDGIGVSEKDRLRGENLNISPQVAAVRRVLLHESLVHKGIHGLPLRHRRLILNWVKQNATPEDLDKLAELYTEYRNWRTSTFQFEALAEEYLAKQVDQLTELPKDGPMARLMDILRQIWEYIVGYKKEPTLTDLKSVVKLLKSGAQAVANDRLKDGGGVKLSIRAYHGTPHKVDRFRTDKIGTGEGNQVFGWGLYFAEAMEVAKKYAEDVSLRKSIDSQNWIIPAQVPSSIKPRLRAWLNRFTAWADWNDVMKQTTRMADGVEEARSFAAKSKGQDNGEANSWLNETEEAAAVLPYLKQYGRDGFVSRGNLYTVELLPAEDTLLDWDAPIHEQPAMLEIANRIMRELVGDREDYFSGYSQMPGSRLYHELGKAIARAKKLTESYDNFAVAAEMKLASEALNRAGVMGIRYFDEKSRNLHYDLVAAEKNVRSWAHEVKVMNSPAAKDQLRYAQNHMAEIERKIANATRNYVIFDENLVRILEENGQSLTPPEGSDIRFSKVDFSTPSDALLNTGSEVSRDTLYDARIIGIRNAIRQAYDAMPKTNSVAVPIGELLSKTQEFAPDVTAYEFSNVLQDMFEDNGAVLQEGNIVEPSPGGLSDWRQVEWSKVPRQLRSNWSTTDREKALLSVEFPKGWKIVNFTDSKGGSVYYEFETTTGKRIRVSVRDHAVSPFREQEFGGVDLVIKVPNAKTQVKSQWSAMADSVTNALWKWLKENPAEYRTNAHATTVAAGSNMISGASQTLPVSPKVNPESSRAAGGTPQINVTTIDGKPAGFVIVMPSQDQQVPSMLRGMASGQPAQQPINQDKYDTALALISDFTTGKRTIKFPRKLAPATGARTGDVAAYSQITGRAGEAATVASDQAGVAGAAARDGEVLAGDGQVFDPYSVRDFVETATRIGVDDVRIDPSTQYGASALASEDGAIQIRINPERMAESIARSDGDSEEILGAALNEELIHAADLVAARMQWNETNRLQSFDEFVKDQDIKTVNEMIQVARSGNNPEETTRVLFDAISSSINLYGGTDITSLDAVENFLKASDHDTVSAVMGEFVRQMIQSGLYQAVSEASLFRRFIDRVKQLVRRVAAAFAPAKGGQYGEMIRSRLNEIEGILDFASRSTGIKASKVDPENAAAKRLKEDADAASAGSVRANFGGVPFKDYEGTSHITKTKKSYEEAAVRFVDDLVNQGIRIDDIADSVMSPAFLERVGIKDDLAMINSVVFETRNRIVNTMRKTRDVALRKRLERKHDDISAFSQGVRSTQGQNFALLQQLMQSPRYRWQFIYEMARKQQKQDVQNVVAQNVTNPDELKAGVDADAQASADAATEQNVQDAENATGTQEDVDDDADLRAGEETLNEENKSLWNKVKDWLREIGAAMNHIKSMDGSSKASLSAAQRSDISKMSREEALAFIEDRQKKINKALKTILGEESEAKTPEQKATRQKRKKMVDVAKKRAEKGKSIDPAEAEAAAIEIAENKASQIVYRFEELYRQGFKNPPEGMSKKEQKDSIIRAFRDQVRNPVSFEQFAERLSNLKVGEEVAERMFLTASRERADLIRVKQFRIDKRRVEIADKQASRLIYSTEEKFRQGSKDLETSKDGDSINRAFREQVSDPMTLDDFVKRLAKLNVSADVANRLFKTAAREKTDLEAMKAYELLEGPDALARMLRELNRARPGEQAPLSRQIPWRTILSQKASTVAEYRQRIFDVVSSNEAFANLTDEQKQRLTDLFAQAWEQNRTRILDSMLENRIRQEQARNNLTKAGAEALQKQRMKLVEDLNLGILDNEQLMIRLAEKFGIKAEYTEQEREQIDKLLDILQDEKTNAALRASAASKLLSTLSDVTKVPIAKIIADFWVASVLNGFNTIFSIGAAVASGAFELLSGFSRVIRTGFQNPQEVPGAIVDSFKAFRNMLAAFPMAARASWQYLVTGDRLFLDPSMNDITKDLNYEQIGRTTALAENLAKSENKLAKVVGLYMRTVSRLLTALDNFNSTSTKFGSLPIVFRSLKLTPEKLAQIQEKNNLQMYIERVIRNDFNGVQPKNMRERATVEAYARAEMMKDLDELGRVSENADFYGMQGAMTLDPTGIGGAIYKGLRDFTGGMSKSADNYIAAAKRRWQIKEDPVLDFINLASAYFMQFIAYNASNMAGFRFARFAGNKFNQGLSFIPGIGMLRKFEADSEKNPIRGKEAFIDMIDRNQMAGMALAVIGYVLLEAIADEPDDEKRGWAINGGWGNLTPEKKKQLLAAGMKEYTIRIGDKVYNYINWPISSALAAIGGLSDLIRFSPEAWGEKDVVSRLGTAAASGIFAATDIPALSTVQELFGSNLSSKDPVANKLDRLARVMSGYAGGFVPRILKDFDYLAEPGLRKYETLWEKTASHIPVYRRHVGEEYYDILGRQIERKVYPGSREFLAQPTEPEYRILGALNSRGIWLTPANAEHRMVGRGSRKRNLTQEEADAYSLETGRGYRQMLLKYGQRALRMPPERAQAFLQDLADDVRDRALMRVYRGYRPAE